MKNSLFAPLLALLLLLPAPASAQPAGLDDLLPIDTAYPLSVTRLSETRIEVRWAIADGYYLYKHRMGADAPNAGIVLQPLQLPPGKAYRDEFFGDVETYRQEVAAVLALDNPQGLGYVEFTLKYQGCADIGICYPPQKKRVRVPLTDAAASGPADPLGLKAGGADALPEDQAFQVELIAGAPDALMARLTPAEGYYLYRDKLAFSLPGAGAIALGAARLPEPVWYPDPEFGTVPVYFTPIEFGIPLQRRDTAAATLDVRVDFQGCKENGLCYPPMQRTLQVAVPAGGQVNAAAAEGADTGVSELARWLPALLLALLGGLILNLMPCVLPVLSFKAMALAKANTPGHARSHALWYTAGVMVSFAALGAAVLALRGAGQALGWGFQLQQPLVVGALALLMFAIGLMMSGLYNWGSGFAGMGQSLTEKSGPAGDFFTGVLAVVVASPCTAPFMGSALAFAFTAHWLLALSVFLALGLGLALPFLLIGFVPALATRLPKPGAWMDTLKHWLAYPMYLTAVWLAWVFGKQKGVNGLALLLIAAIALSAALWWFERQKLQPRIKAKAVALLLALVAAAGFGFALRQETPRAGAVAAQGVNYEAFSRKRLDELRAAGTPVFVDMTADWCITCKVNEKAVLHTDAFTQLLKDTGTVYLVGDWTNQDPEITAYLDQYRTPGVPLYVVYPKGPGPGRQLPQLLTFEIMREALAP